MIIKNKYIYLKLVFLLLLVFLFFSIQNSYGESKFVKKIDISSIQNPSHWKEEFDPGQALTILLKDKIKNSNQLELIYLTKTSLRKKISNSLVTDKNIKAKNSEEKIKKNEGSLNLKETFIPFKIPSSQFQLTGKIILFSPGIKSTKQNKLKIISVHHKEIAKIKARVELINLHTGRSLAKREFEFTSSNGRKNFDLSLSSFNFNKNEFELSSIELALLHLGHAVEKFIIKVLNDFPIQGNIISVNTANKSAIINLGKSNGVSVQDVFIVFSMETKFKDPLNDTDLGDKYNRKGVIKINEVQGKFSKSYIMVGLDLAPGDLVVPKDRLILNNNLEGKQSQKGVTWGPYKGIPSLSY